MKRALFFAAATLMTASPAQADTDAILSGIDARSENIEDTARKLWEWAEVGYQEEKSTELLKQQLRGEGFSITSGVADIPTAFVAEAGKGGPVIAILAEYDALPGINQDSVGTRSPIEGKNVSHACGHNLFAAGSVEAAIAVKKWLETSGTPGRVRLYGTPAEEGGSGKVYMVREGLFDDVDFSLHWHAADENSAAATNHPRQSLGEISLSRRFRPCRWRTAQSAISARWSRSIQYDGQHDA